MSEKMETGNFASDIARIVLRKTVYTFIKRIFNYNMSSVTNGEVQRYEEEQREEKEKMKEDEMEIEKVEKQPIKDFLKDVNYEAADSSLAIQLNQMLRKYTSRKMKLEEREKEVGIISQQFKYKNKYLSLLFCK